MCMKCTWEREMETRDQSKWDQRKTEMEITDIERVEHTAAPEKFKTSKFHTKLDGELQKRVEVREWGEIKNFDYFGCSTSHSICRVSLVSSYSIAFIFLRKFIRVYVCVFFYFSGFIQ